MYKTYGNASEIDIEFLEDKYNLKLPDDYKYFLQVCNGGVLRPDYEEGIPLIWKDKIINCVNVHVMYGVNTGAASDFSDDPIFDIDFWMDEYGDDAPPHSLLIGDSPFGGFFVLIAEGEDTGVWFWDSNPSYHIERPDDGTNTYFIAKTFTEFSEKYLGWKP